MNIFSIFFPPQEDEKLKELATKFASNLVDVSTRFEEKDDPHKETIKEIERKKYRTPEQRERFILITGAGASHAATKGVMPLSSQAIINIKREFDKAKFPHQIIEEEIEKIKLTTRLDVREFETQLLAYSKYSQKRVINGLKKMCDLKHVPNLTYEILAHLVKHRFIDVAINFNFDEIFDILLKEEISSSEFRFIYSDGHCPEGPDGYEKELLINNRLKQPIYIKPHGTISHSNSLRFTRERFATLPEEIKKIITKVIEAPLPKAEQKNLRINFIIVGFGMKSSDLMQIIKENLQPTEKNITPFFWIFDKKRNLKEFNLELTDEQRKIIAQNSHIFKVDNHDTLDNYLRALWELIEQSFEDNYLPIGIERHLLINLIFNSSKKEIQRRTQPDNLKDYFRDRLLVELVISFLSSDGILNLNQIMESRVSQYLQLYNDLVPLRDKLPIRDLCNKIGLTAYKKFIPDAFVLQEPEDFYGEFLYDNLIKKLSNGLSTERKSILKKKKDDFVKLAKIIKSRNSLNINPQFKHPHKNLFSPIDNEDILNTSLAWLYRYRKILKNNDDWDLLLAVSEKGRFLDQTNEENALIFKGKKVELVLSSFDLPGFEDVPSLNVFEGLEFLSKVPLYLPWKFHNRHMVLFLKYIPKKNIKRQIENWIIKDGIYFESRLLSRKVNPIHINDDGDYNNKVILLETFVNYWYRAKEYSKNKNSNQRFIPIIKDKEELYDHMDDLLIKYIQK
jgi:hypothetical protein